MVAINQKPKIPEKIRLDKKYFDDKFLVNLALKQWWEEK